MELELVEHARAELERMGEDPGVSACLIATVAAFASYRHSGPSHWVAADLLWRLLRHEALTELTADPEEWADRSVETGSPLWQNRRDFRVFSCDGGRTYTRVDSGDGGPQPTVAPPGWVRALCERDQVSEDAAVAAVWAYLDAGPITAADRAELDLVNEPPRTRYMRARYMRRRWGPLGAPVAELLYEPRPAAGVAPVVGPVLGDLA